ncbi:MAG: protein-glutamate O-methyltransferase CheR [Clostridiales bacterium]|nr:protein-glutamate O-methyltransferase CheR [Clostridiales bacterium]
MRPFTDSEFTLIQDYIKNNFGISLKDDKKSLIYSRLHKTVESEGLDTFGEYLEFIKKDGAGMSRLIDKIVTNHTYFMRETDHFTFFERTILPYIEREYAVSRDLRLWCAGCSSGEEAYTLQMITQDYFDGKIWDTRILATDISAAALDKAAAGAYSKSSVKKLPAKWINRYLSEDVGGDSYSVKDNVKRNMIFRRFNLMDNAFSFKKPFQVIFCRNVMIYFDAKTREELIEKFYKATDNGGYLVLGHSEQMSAAHSKFSRVARAIYRK